MKKLLTLLIFTLQFASAQELLTLQQAIIRGLEHNYDILIARQESEIAENNVHVGNAGFLPTVTLNGTVQESSNNTRQEYTNGQIVDRTGAAASVMRASAALNWTIFDGMKMFATLSSLKTRRDVSTVSYKARIEATILSITQLYYRIVLRAELNAVLQETKKISEQRMKLISDKYEVGSASRLEYLQAQVDLNEDISGLLTGDTELRNLKSELNELIGNENDADYQVESSIPPARKLELGELLEQINKGNSQLQTTRLNRSLADLAITQARARYFPTLSLFGLYEYSRSKNDAGFFALNTTYGYTLGATLSYPLFDGFNTSREVENAIVNQRIAELREADTQESLISEAGREFRKYKNSAQLVEFEEKNLTVAEENLAIAIERLRLGTYSPLELREAQKSLLLSKTRLISAEYDLKIQEQKLLQLSGQLLQ